MGREKNDFCLICDDGWWECIIFGVKEVGFCVVGDGVCYGWGGGCLYF